MCLINYFRLNVITFLLNDPTPTEIYTLSYTTLFRSRESFPRAASCTSRSRPRRCDRSVRHPAGCRRPGSPGRGRSEEHTSELQSHVNLVCRLLLEKKKKLNFFSLASATSSQDRILHT